MAQQLQTVSIKAAGFSGLNTEDSPVTIDPSFAEVAEIFPIHKNSVRGITIGLSGKDEDSPASEHTACRKL